MAWDIERVRKDSYKYGSEAQKEVKRLQRQGYEVYADAPNVTHLRRKVGYEPPKPKKVKQAEGEGSD